MNPSQFVDFYSAQRASAILRTPHGQHAGPAMAAAVRGGFRIIEFTLNTPGALDLIRKFASGNDEVVVGAGTVLSAEEVHQSIDAGAKFIVSPVVDVEVIKAAVERGAAVMPGCSTPTEMLLAHRAGASLVKVFPQQEPVWVKQTLGPLPFLKIVPTSGVHLNNCAAFIKAGAHAVGFVNTLFDGNDIANAAFDRIEERARRMLEAVRNA
ncbi:MAG: bifunctional 4-hydroxy-2-oxoglutarate aldolase/2-dehydro-3-deoxy-phosphogluconate aldolase [Phycisphaeraceae bacterium]